MMNKNRKLPARKDVHPTLCGETGDNEYNSNSSKSDSDVG